MAPRRSAAPTVSSLPKKVAIMAPSRTARRPSGGKTERVAGGCGVSAIVLPGRGATCSRGMDRNLGREARPKKLGLRILVDGDPDGNTLHYLGVVPGGVVRRKKGKLRTAGWSDLLHVAVEGVREGIDMDIDRIPYAHPRQLGLPVVRFNPHTAFDQGSNLHACRDQLAWMHPELADVTIRRRRHLGIGEIHLARGNGRFASCNLRKQGSIL